VGYTTSVPARSDLVGAVTLIVGVTYAAVFAALLVVVLTRHDAAAARVQREAGAAATMWTLAGAMPTPEPRMRHDVAAYVDAVIRDEWPQMRQGRASTAARRALDDLNDSLDHYSPPGEREMTPRSTAAPHFRPRPGSR
jgi:hypothetical protein